MATLEELRRWARGHRVEGLPNPLRRRGIPKPKIGAFHTLAKNYRINNDGTDALFLFGKYKGSLVSQLVNTQRGRIYLRWVRKKDFAEDLKEVCRYHLELWDRGQKQKKA